MQKDQENIAQALEERNQRLAREQAEKQKLEQILAEMNNKLVMGGEILRNEQDERLADTRKVQLELEQQRKKAKKLQAERKKQEEAMLNTEKKYENVQQELEESRLIIKKLKANFWLEVVCVNCTGISILYRECIL